MCFTYTVQLLCGKMQSQELSLWCWFQRKCNDLPVKYSVNSCSSLTALSKVFLACSSVKRLFISLQRHKRVAHEKWQRKRCTTCFFHDYELPKWWPSAALTWCDGTCYSGTAPTHSGERIQSKQSCVNRCSINKTNTSCNCMISCFWRNSSSGSCWTILHIWHKHPLNYIFLIYIHICLWKDKVFLSVFLCIMYMPFLL